MSAEQAADASKVDASEDMSELEIEYMQYSSEELLQGIIDRVDFNATTHGQRDIDDDRRRGHDPVVRSQHSCAQPVESLREPRCVRLAGMPVWRGLRRHGSSR